MDGQPPSHARVVVIGGGVMGRSTLYHLAKLGVCESVLFDPSGARMRADT